jgi:hypothetical protein
VHKLALFAVLIIRTAMINIKLSSNIFLNALSPVTFKPYSSLERQTEVHTDKKTVTFIILRILTFILLMWNIWWAAINASTTNV